MYGTVMIGRSGASAERMIEITKEWAAAKGKDAGFVDEWIMRADDGRVVMAVRFASKADYERLAEDPDQDVWWSQKLRPMLDAEPEWIDGTWHST